MVSNDKTREAEDLIAPLFKDKSEVVIGKSVPKEAL